MVGGVSIGALMGAVWCGERDIIGMIRKAGHWAKVLLYIINLLNTTRIELIIIVF